jgi:ribonucleoside-diphosphate reductase alpha chain
MSVHKQLRGISSDRAVGLGPNKVLSVPDAIGIALYEWHQDKQGVQQELLRQTGEYPAFDSTTPVSTPVVVPVSGQGGAQSEATSITPTTRASLARARTAARSWSSRRGA